MTTQKLLTTFAKNITLPLAILLLIQSTAYAQVTTQTTTQTTTPQKVKRVAQVETNDLNNEQLQPEQNDSKETFCTFEHFEKPIYKGKFINIKNESRVAPEEVFEMQVKIQNTGNTPWFSSDSGCPNVPVINLGTARERDRWSPFLKDKASMDQNILGANRVKMDQKRVNPSETATFTFWATAPENEGIYREYFAPVVEATTWIEGDALFATDIQVGHPQLSEEQQKYLTYIQKSANLANVDFNGQKKIEVDLSEQKMHIKIGETIIRSFPISSGARRTPTPPGNFSIMSKQEVRVAGKKPHYIMPKFMMFKAGGYGIHALPSLANDRGVFWREALNHIGTPRSHGCIRLLPEDAQFAYDFADVGTPVVVKW